MTRFNDVTAKLHGLRIVPVIVLENPDDASPLASALEEGGLPCAEITFRTDRAAEALRRICTDHPSVLAGAGTVLDVNHAKAARDAGAAFVVSPGLSRAVVEYCLANDMPVFPGVCTPTEITAAIDMGVSVLKFYPVEPLGGVTMLQTISGPFRGVRFMPSGGVTPQNVRRYLDLPNVVSCGGTWIAPSDHIAAGQFDRIAATARQAVMIARTSHEGG